MSFRMAGTVLVAIPAAFLVLLNVLPTRVPAPDSATAPSTWAIVDAVVFDGFTRLEGRQRIVVEGHRITAIGPDVDIPVDAHVVDADGATVMPGLIDAHVHAYGDGRRDALRFGVTTVLDMFGTPAALSRAQADRRAASQATQADLFGAGYLATAPKGHGTEYGFTIPTLTAPDEADAWVAARIADGSDFIKVVYEAPDAKARHPSIDRPTLEAVIRAAHRHDRKTYVHAMAQASAKAVVEAGGDGLVHIFVDRPVDKAIVSLLVDRGTTVVATLSVIAAASGQPPPEMPALEERLRPHQRRALATKWPHAETRAKQIEVALANVRALHAAGVVVLAGTDAQNPGTTLGFSLHGELMLLVQAGLTPLEALRAATSATAERFGLTDRGRLQPGALADLVLVEGDPTVDISATQAIRAIWKNGKPYDPHDRPGSQTLQPGLLSAFDSDLGSEWGVEWSATTDQMMGGQSTVALGLTEGGTMRMVGEVKAGAQFRWAGAGLALSPDWSVVGDLAAIETISFRARGRGGPFRALLFSPDLASPPATASFEVGEAWRTIRLPLSKFGSFPPVAERNAPVAERNAPVAARKIRGLSVVGGPHPGRFQLEIDDVRMD